MEPLLLTTTDAAKTLGLSRSKLYEMLAAGDLPSVRLGGSRRIRASDLRAYVDALAAA